jgi:asparagine synthase (glutamine-hydrolysing)
MCGIVGILTFNEQSVISSQLKVMTDTLAHRGPDGEGIWLNDSNSVGLGHRRLSIIDLSEKAAQPFHYLDRYTIIYNGEIYNYIELRDELRKYGYTFTTQSDTEVLVAAYDKYGTEMFRHLDGMFAFAIWDNKEKKLFSARDRFGEKPFYFFYEKGNKFVFASEMKAMFNVGITKTINKHMLYNFIVHRLEENPFDRSETFFENIFSLEPAHYIVINQDGTFHKQQYWQLKSTINESITFEEAENRFTELFNLSIKRRLRSDVPVGSSLSGGLDSSAVVCSLHKFRDPNTSTQNTFSARFHDPIKDEGSYMKIVVNATSVIPHEVWIDEQILIDDLDKICYYQEEPFGSASILAQWKVMQLAKRKNVTVLLDGQGADEILAGYVHFFRPYFTELYLNDQKKLKYELKKYKDLRGNDFDLGIKFKLNARFPHLMLLPGMIKRKFTNPAYCKFMSKDFLHDYKNETQPFTSIPSLNEALLYSSTVYGLDRLLRFADRNAMAHGREVRLPFLFHELVEFIFTLPPSFKIHNGWTKYLLRKSMESRLPSDITWRVSKLGYEVPQDLWMKRSHIAERVRNSREFLTDEKIFNPRFASIADDWICLITAAFLRSG